MKIIDISDIAVGKKHKAYISIGNFHFLLSEFSEKKRYDLNEKTGLFSVGKSGNPIRQIYSHSQDHVIRVKGKITIIIVARYISAMMNGLSAPFDSLNDGYPICSNNCYISFLFSSFPDTKAAVFPTTVTT